MLRLPNETPRVIVSVYNDAGVPATVLAQAEQETQKIFGRAGLQVAWRYCSGSANRVDSGALAGAGGTSRPV